MSFGRTLANICTLGLWSFTDPDLEEFWKPIKGTAMMTYSTRRQADAETIMAEFKWLKKDWSKDRKAVLIPSYKDSDALAEWLEDNRPLFDSKEGLELGLWAPYYQAYKREVDGRIETFCSDGFTIHCKECGAHVAYARKVHKRFKCKLHPKAGTFANKPKRASEHEYVSGTASYWGVRFDHWSDYEDNDDDD